MKTIQLTKNLWLHEYIPEQLYREYESRGMLKYLVSRLDRNLINSDQSLRDHFGAITINNWYNGGNRQWSGLRTSDSPYYSVNSMHSYYKASDKLFANGSPEEWIQYAIDHAIELGITGIEEGVTWLHTDTRMLIGEEYKIFGA